MRWTVFIVCLAFMASWSFKAIKADEDEDYMFWPDFEHEKLAPEEKYEKENIFVADNLEHEKSEPEETYQKENIIVTDNLKYSDCFIGGQCEDSNLVGNKI